MANGFVNRYSYPRVSVSVQTSVRTSNVLSLPRTNRFSYPNIGLRIIDSDNNLTSAPDLTTTTNVNVINGSTSPVSSVNSILLLIPQDIRKDIINISSFQYSNPESTQVPISGLFDFYV